MAGGAAFWALRPLPLTTQEVRWPGLAGAIVINGLGGIVNPNLRVEAERRGERSRDAIDDPSRRPLDRRALEDLLASGTTAVNVTVGHVAGDVDPFVHTVGTIARWQRRLQDQGETLLHVRGTADIHAAKTSGRVGVILGFQNATMLEHDPERVDVFADLGVRIQQLTYNGRNALGDGSMVPENRGLTSVGRQMVERLNAAGLLIDLSHSGERTCLDAARASGMPICISHTGCRALSDLPRNKTDAELREVAERGGVIGIYFMPFLRSDGHPDATDVVAHIEHAVDVCGEDHVGIGTDGGTTAVDDLEEYRESVAREVERRRAAGVSAAGERPGVVPFIPDLQGPTQFQRLADLLHARGHGSERIEKILGRNFLRVMNAVWPA